MENYSILGNISLLAFFVTLLLNLYLLTVKGSRTLSNRLLAACFLLNAIDISVFFTYQFSNEHLVYNMIRSHLPYLGAPLIYLYVVSVCYANFRLRPIHLLHTIPFFLVILVVVPRFYLANDPTRADLLQHFNTSIEGRLIFAIGHLQTLGYSIAMFVTLYRYKKQFLENYADADSYSYKWLMQLTIITALAHLLGIIKGAFRLYGYVYTHYYIQIFVTLLFLGILCWIVLKVMYTPELFRGIDSRIPLVAELDTPPPSQASHIPATRTPAPHTSEPNSSAPSTPKEDPAITERIEFLRKHMEVTEPFLESAITIQQLAAQTKIPVRDLSLLINHHIGQHFFDFINEYRIRKAMSIFRDPSQKDLNIQEVFYQVGFNSKSSFNTAFRKQTGLTPTQYKNNSLSNS
ncbi:helix-turn-helix domain-containing protein [Chitinophaga pendula]|uniref:helix-turn-helix domain-containing protein n=1 Tax=Chitinophaga TaxID=79328 RepID=UPI0012FD6BEA|nr:MULTISPECIES: helix-turn-helix domain-containing protein [Chitinophaga]UCJ05192.1 helix-turn-helix domain-containing protein [Chitinophaga pendula]